MGQTVNNHGETWRSVYCVSRLFRIYPVSTLSVTLILTEIERSPRTKIDEIFEERTRRTTREFITKVEV